MFIIPETKCNPQSQKPNVTFIKTWYISHKPFLLYTHLTLFLSTHSHTHTHTYKRFNRFHNAETCLHYDFLKSAIISLQKLIFNVYTHSHYILWLHNSLFFIINYLAGFQLLTIVNNSFVHIFNHICKKYISLCFELFFFSFC